MAESGVRVEVADQVGTVTFARPEALNALDTPAKTALLSALSDLAADPDVRCVVLTGSGRAFCVGQDLREHVQLLRQGSPDELLATVPEHYNPIALALHEMDKPVIAAVNGVAAGAGASLAFLADYRLVAASAGFNLAFAGIALSCDTGCSWTLPRLVGPTRALELLFNPRTISAAESLQLGIATEVVDDEAFADRVHTLSRSLAAGPTRAYAAIRRSVASAASSSLAEALTVEAEMMRWTGASTDHRNAVEAFLAKQKPEFTGS
jgi:2-(1,2-epoxy-1,2-dihydrophenyl)acetyl-CoA isomerase